MAIKWSPGLQSYFLLDIFYSFVRISLEKLVIYFFWFLINLCCPWIENKHFKPRKVICNLTNVLLSRLQLGPRYPPSHKSFCLWFQKLQALSWVHASIYVVLPTARVPLLYHICVLDPIHPVKLISVAFKWPLETIWELSPLSSK